MFNRAINKIQILIFALVLGIAATAGGAYMLHKQSIYTKTTATITKITETYNAADNNYDHDVYVSYEVDGKSYNEELNYYEGGYKEGQEVTIAYNPDNPAEITTGEKGFGIYLVIIGPIILVGGLIKIIFGR